MYISYLHQETPGPNPPGPGRHARKKTITQPQQQNKAVIVRKIAPFLHRKKRFFPPPPTLRRVVTNHRVHLQPNPLNRLRPSTSGTTKSPGKEEQEPSSCGHFFSWWCDKILGNWKLRPKLEITTQKGQGVFGR